MSCSALNSVNYKNWDRYERIAEGATMVFVLLTVVSVVLSAAILRSETAITISGATGIGVSLISQCIAGYISYRRQKALKSISLPIVRHDSVIRSTPILTPPIIGG